MFKVEAKTVLALIPAYNEAETIVATVRGLKSIPEITKIIVVDDGSKDLTAKLAAESGAEVITMVPNGGKGKALNRGLKEFKEDVLVLIDADLGDTSKEAAKLLRPILQGEAQMTIARFPKAKKKGGFGLVKGLAHFGIKAFTGLETQAPISGQRAMTKEVVEALGGFASGFGVEVAMTIDVARKGFKIMEVETLMSHGETGRDLAGFMHRGKQFWHIAKVLITKVVN